MVEGKRTLKGYRFSKFTKLICSFGTFTDNFKSASYSDMKKAR